MGTGYGTARQSAMDRVALELRWLQLTRETLPALAQSRDWPVRDDHCFQRILLDHAVGGRWYDVLDRRSSPVFAQLDDGQLAAAVALAERVLAEGDPLLRELDAQSLAWRGKRPLAGQIGLGIDHSAISVSDADASAAFYAGLGLRPGKRSHNKGAEQQRLDGLKGVQAIVAPLQPSHTPPHLELLCYQVPHGEAGPPLRANDVAATRVAWRGDRPALLRDPDGHLHQIET